VIGELCEVIDRADRAGHEGLLSRQNELSRAPRESVRTMVRALLHLGAMRWLGAGALSFGSA
ncbi:MAG TPA: hypothetical protein VFL43_12135, partial [Variovorax sp.]|nr:hypothetical protein [Variovorax sp.]